MRKIGKILKRVGQGAALVCGAYGVSIFVVDRKQEWAFKRRMVAVAQSADSLQLNVRPTVPLPSRKDLLVSLASEEFDVLVIGGGASGAGVALDAQTRGLSTALVEMDDFSSGTSSRSTKLIHGGVRYLQAAIMHFDTEQYRMVKEALFERANLLEIAPHLSAPLPIMLPLYKYWQVPYYWAGIKAYDFVSGKRILKSSFYINKTKALELFPMLKKEKLVGALIYYDGQHNDARMNLAIALSAIRHGAKCTNHTEVVGLLYSTDAEGKRIVSGAHVKDVITGKEFDVKAKCVINATGPFTDTIRVMDNPKIDRICAPSQGVHIVLPGYYSPASTGLLDPSTKDGRVIFFLPWEKVTVAGTTDTAAEVTHSPAPSEKEIQFILEEVKNYLSSDISVRRGDVLRQVEYVILQSNILQQMVLGLRPLVRDPSKKDTKSLARNHIIEVSDTNMITIAGGKWTTYRSMAQETVDAAVKVCKLNPSRDCVTPGLFLEGGHNYNPLMYIQLVQDFGLEVEVAQHLAHTYGDRAFSVAKLEKLTGKRWPIIGTRLHEEFPYLESEVRYAVREYAMTAVDLIGRRLRLAFLNTYAAEEALPRVVEIMAEELNWDKKEQQRQFDEAQVFIDTEMGKLARLRAVEEAPLNLSKEEKEKAIKRFNSLDIDKKGFITINDLRRRFKVQHQEKGEKIDERVLHEILKEIDLNKNGQVDLMEFLQVFSGLKHGTVTQSRFAKYMEDGDTTLSVKDFRRSGGGV